MPIWDYNSIGLISQLKSFDQIPEYYTVMYDKKDSLRKEHGN